MSNITEIRIKKINKGNLLAATSVCIDNCVVVNEIKLLNGKNGRHINMANRKLKNKNIRKIFAYPINEETKVQLLEAISEAYNDISL